MLWSAVSHSHSRARHVHGRHARHEDNMTDHTKNIIEVKNLSYSYPTGYEALSNVNLNIHKGDYLGIIGPNGGGKTTFIKLLLKLLTPASGSIKIFDKPIVEFGSWDKIGYVAQKATDFDNRFPVTVYDVVAMGRTASAGLFHPLAKDDKEAISTALKEVEMWELKDRLIGNLSGGQQQRVFIARALAQKPEIIFLDEPTSGVDVSSQEHFYKLLKKLNMEKEITLVIISHDVDIIANEVTEIACINGGLIFYGTVDEFEKKGNVEKLYSKGVKYIKQKYA